MKASVLIKSGLLLVLLIVLGITTLLTLQPRTRPSPAASIPQPNGYDDLLRAGANRFFSPDEGKDLKSWTTESLKEFIEKNGATLSLVREGLSKRCLVPVDQTLPTETYINNHMPALGSLKGLAVLLRAEGELAVRDQRLGDAARSFLDCIQLGQEIRRGGLLIDGLLGVSCEAIGARELLAISEQLDAQQCRKAAKRLDEMDAKRESAQSIIANETGYFFERGGLKVRLAQFFGRKALEKGHANFTGKAHSQERDTKRLLTSLASRAYKLEKGTLPKNIGDLVPEYIRAVPVDPESRKPVQL